MPPLVHAGYRPVAINPRGVEASEGPLVGLTLHDLAADVAGVVESLDVGAVHVLGHGFGNRIARCVAADRPDLVRSVILMAADGQLPGDDEAHGAMGRLSQPGGAESDRLADLETALFAPASDASVWLDLVVWAEAQEAQDDADRATPREEWLEGGSAPMLVIQGRHDRLAPPTNGRWLRERLGTRVELVELASAGHALFPEQPDEIIDAIRRFTAGL
jgi:pimeloyl-ACP methyl ester carboxylesterase